MASLDDTYEALIQFRRTLLEFNETLSSSVAEVRQRHSVIEGAWQDEAARQYQAAFGPFADTMDAYLAHRAPRFEDFLRDKVADLDRYLHGGS